MIRGPETGAPDWLKIAAEPQVDPDLTELSALLEIQEEAAALRADLEAAGVPVDTFASLPRLVHAWQLRFGDRALPSPNASYDEKER
jgi:hypothetical protein